MIEFDVEGRPVPFTRTGSRGKCRSCGSREVTVARYSEPRYRSYREVVAWEAKAAGARPVEGPVVVKMIIASGGVTVVVDELEGNLRYDRPRGDIDNYGKAILDSLNGIAYVDDRQVVILDASFKTR